MEIEVFGLFFTFVRPGIAVAKIQKSERGKASQGGARDIKLLCKEIFLSLYPSHRKT
jgi:hypothetical protein